VYFTLRLFKQRIALRFNKQAFVCISLLTMSLFFILMLSVLTGSYSLSMHDVFFGLFGQSQTVIDDQAVLIIGEFRLPRSLVAILSGGLFALSGALLQNLTRNPLADPSLVGISQGAALAVVTLTILFPEYLNEFREISAFCGAIIIAVMIQLLSGKGHKLKFILLGIGVAAFISAIISTLLTYGNLQSAMIALSWLAGSTHESSWYDVIVLSITLVVIISFALFQARKMSVISLGDEVAIGLGIHLKKAMLIQLSISVSAAAIATAVVGPLGFIGLLAPHLANRIKRSGPASHLLLSMLVGANLVLIADFVGRALFAPTQIAAGLVTSLVGAPLFAYLLMKKHA
jgi:iron complex transport system permease protein